MNKVNYFDLGLHTGTELFNMALFFFQEGLHWHAYGFEACELFHNFCKERFQLSSQIEIIHGAISNTEEDIKLYYAENPVGHSVFKSKNVEVCDYWDQNENQDVTFRIPMMFSLCFKDYDKKTYQEVSNFLTLEKIAFWIKKWTKTQGLIPIVRDQNGSMREIGESNIQEWFRNMFCIPGGERPKYEICKGIIFSKWLEENVPDFKSSFNILRVNIEGAEYHLFKDLIENDLLKYFNIFCGTGHDVEKISEYSTDEYYKMLEDNSVKIYRFTDWKPELNDPIDDIIIEKLEDWRTKNVLP